mmetsp:Transcript_19783/g.47208  ORF Transcript_19783/g.47208 Transcript_19783/m.47208 type:complete len:202 (+) Transcript_19783:226-831(+)
MYLLREVRGLRAGGATRRPLSTPLPSGESRRPPSRGLAAALARPALLREELLQALGPPARLLHDGALGGRCLVAPLLREVRGPLQSLQRLVGRVEVVLELAVLVPLDQHLLLHLLQVAPAPAFPLLVDRKLPARRARPMVGGSASAGFQELLHGRGFANLVLAVHPVDLEFHLRARACAAGRRLYFCVVEHVELLHHLRVC